MPSAGRTFLSHSLAGGDVAWEAVATEQDLAGLGFRYVVVVGVMMRARTRARACVLWAGGSMHVDEGDAPRRGGTVSVQEGGCVQGRAGGDFL